MNTSTDELGQGCGDEGAGVPPGVGVPVVVPGDGVSVGRGLVEEPGGVSQGAEMRRRGDAERREKVVPVVSGCGMRRAGRVGMPGRG
jgi:hypothetical protein